MVKLQDTTLEGNVAEFRAEYEGSLQALSAALDEARISHYSSGCGHKSITFDIFPASGHITELLSMLSLERQHKKTGALRDASAKGNYNPAQEFLSHLRRWSHFAEQVMQYEGDAPRGVAAASAKLIMADLIMRLHQTPAMAGKVGDAVAKYQSRIVDFPKLMRGLGLTLEAREKTGSDEEKTSQSAASQQNYFKALSAAQRHPFNPKNAA